MKKAISILLALCLCLGLCACNSLIREKEPEEPTITLTLKELNEFAENSSSHWEFYQRFFADTIVYKNQFGQYCYADVNKDLPLSDYDWNNLRDATPLKGGKLKEYVVDGEVKSMKGIDVSRYQSEIDWEKVAADGVEFAMIQVGYRGYSKGGLVKDIFYDKNIEGALASGIQVGVYFVTQAVSPEEAVEEAEFVLDLIRPYKITWPVALDLEEVGGSDSRAKNLDRDSRTDIICAFCDRIAEDGYTPMLYSAIRWYVEEMDLTRLTAYNKWFAQYFNQPFFPYEFQIWQYSDSGKIDGISGNVDMNLGLYDYREKAPN